MEPEILFLLGIYLVPLALVSLASAWADSRRPWVALLLLALSGGVLGYVALMRDEGLFALREIPDMTVAMIARIVANL